MKVVTALAALLLAGVVGAVPPATGQSFPAPIPPPISVLGGQEEPVDVDAEVARLMEQYAMVGIHERQCLQVALANPGTLDTSATSSGYRSDATSTFDTRASARSSSSFYGSRSGGNPRNNTFVRSGSSDSVYSGTVRSVDRGSSDSASIGSFSSPEMRVAACRQLSEASSRPILLVIQQARSDPKAFAAYVRVNRVRDREIQAQRAAGAERARFIVHQELEALISASPPVMGMAAFSGHLESLESGLVHLTSMTYGAQQDAGRAQTLGAVERAVQGFRVARDRWSTGDIHTSQIANLEDAIQEGRQKLASKGSIVVQAELDTHEYNLKAEKTHLQRLTRQSESAWGNALPAANVAVGLVAGR